MEDKSRIGAVTIYDVAVRAGVSITTVSNTLNRPEKVAPGTRSKVMAAIDELGFVPRSEAVSRARRGLGRVGVIAPITTYPSFGVRLRGIIQGLSDEPFELVVYDQASLAVRSNYLESLPIGDRLDGLVVMSLPFSDEISERLLARHLPTVLVEFTRDEFDSVTIDDAKGGSLAARHLLARGHSRFAYVGESQASEWIVAQSGRRLAGYRESLENAGVDLDPENIVLVEPGPAGGAKAIEQLMSGANPPTAVFVHSDHQALGVLEGARKLGIDVPEDLAVVGFDDLDFAGPVGLTTVAQPLEESGRRAVRSLLERIRDPDAPPRRIELGIRLVARHTTNTPTESS